MENETTQTVNPKIAALAKFLKSTPEEAATLYTEGDYNVYDDAEANEAVRENIMESLWAFNAKFIISHSKMENLDNRQYEVLEKAIKELQGKLCEDANPLVLALIDNIDRFVDEAVGTDGRGHFLSGYDGEENEQDGFYIYRSN